MEHLEFLRNMIVSMCSDVKHRAGAEHYMKDGVFLLPSFNVPKGIEPPPSMLQQPPKCGLTARQGGSAS